MTSSYRTRAGEIAIQESYLQLLDRWPAPNQRHRVSTGEGETFVIESGPKEAPPVLLLHGTASNSAMWLGDVSGWSRHLRVFAVDIIGDAGFSAASRPPLDSDAHARWLDDVLAALSLERVSLVGISLGGWLALDFATRRPQRVEKLVVINPGGVGRPRNVLLWALPLLMLGGWGRRKMMERIAGKPSGDPSPERDAAAGFTELVFKHFRPRTASLPQFSDEALSRLTMPVMAILGGKDAFIDAPGARARLEAHVDDLKISFLPDAHHFIPGQGPQIEAFLVTSPDESG
ncbi:alpha/beta hydrolase [Phyllobacterium salinisoli]|uniref:Alpha/beta hydrolase n=1 Tax=Phyllobacterium salinisoli TaxID=1899321 RepID=A0A368K8K9_9HYPH|nr:alpha/beta hydrolase [Phyllobacterium salinisoli]RCS25698.1 alpha/beta hydrolase [Phyllobacterium salinisoli]